MGREGIFNKRKAVLGGAGAVGATFAYAVAQDGVADEIVLTVSTLMQGQYGLDGICLSVPCMVAESGIERVIDAKLTQGEAKALRHSADLLEKAWAELKEGGTA